MFRKPMKRARPTRPVGVEGAELTDDDLEFVVGGLRRPWAPEGLFEQGVTTPASPQDPTPTHLVV